jgi:hypothetical protein
VKRILAILMACLFMIAVMAVIAAPAFADSPKAGESGHFKGSAKQCDRDHPKCPPFGGGG